MGELISKYEYWDHKDSFDSLVVIPRDDKSIRSMFDDYEKINIGVDLSKRLKKLSAKERNSRVESELDLIMNEVHCDRILMDYIDLLFTPQYKFNVLSYFIKKSRNKKVILTWPGYMNSDKLYYSEIGLSDYIEVDIKKQNIVYVY